MAEQRVWRVAEGEEARLTPAGPRAAAILSRGALPLRTRRLASGGHHRPGYAGTYVVLGDAPYEVVEEQTTDEGRVYFLDPWPPEEVIREQVTYGEAFVRGVLAQRAADRERARLARISWPFYPLFGWMPEEQQCALCDRCGLDPIIATFAGGLSEAGLLLALLPWYGGHAFALILALLLLICALLRAVGALFFKEVAGSPVVALAFAGVDAVRGRAWRQLRPGRRMTRAAFWRQLTVPDRVTAADDGTVEVQAALPHVAWRRDGRVRAGEDWWEVRSLPPAAEPGALPYRYRLTSRMSAKAREVRRPQMPAPTAYRDAVLADVRRQWDDLFTAGFRPVIAMLPIAVQQRALDEHGGPASVRQVNLISAAVTLVLGLWFAIAGDLVNVLFGLLLFADAMVRAWWTYRSRYAPSVFGALVAGYLPPERLPFLSHREESERARSAEP